MRTTRDIIAATGSAVLLAALLVGVESASASPSAAPSAEVSIAPAGRGYATPKLVDQRTNPPARPITAPDHATLGLDGKPTGSGLPATTAESAKPTATGNARIPGGPNTGSPGVRPLVPSPTRVNANFDGINQANSGGSRPSDVNASIGPTQILQTVNRRITVYSKAGAQLCTNTLAGWLALGNTNVFDPRTLYDNLNNRFIIIATTTGTAGQAPRLFLAASTTGNACATYFIYTLRFGGSLFPTGLLLDYPYLGQDRFAVLSSTNNFTTTATGLRYLNSTAWSVSKARLYTGAAVSFAAFAVSPSAAPVTVTGIPIGATANAFYVAGVSGTGYRLYRMANTAGPGTTLTLQATIASAWTGPPRRANQCGTASTIDPLDGRIVWAPVQAVGSRFVWFTHGQNLGGRPGVRWGAINTSTNAVFVANAFHSATSDDFNPALGAHEVAPNSFNIWLNWAYTDSRATVCRNTSMAFNGVLPGGGLPTLAGTDLTLVTGSNTTDDRFGDYASVHVDPVGVSGTCPAGRTALLAQQYFVSGAWATRLARISIGSGC
ncbi:hypothetical protein WEI85_12770 [Actinomycetes bacterium KLBMP 9797]